jgi:succinylglutamate desuccinylase
VDNYEIRIVKRDQAVAVHYSEHISDHAAIRRGHILAETGDQVGDMARNAMRLCGPAQPRASTLRYPRSEQR